MDIRLDLLYFSLSGVFNFLTASFLVLLIVFKGHKNLINKILLLTCLATAAYSLPYTFWPLAETKAGAFLLFQIISIGVLFTPISFSHFVVLFLNIKKLNYFIYTGYFLAFFFLAINFTPLFIKTVEPKFAFAFWAVPGPLYHFYVVYLFLYFLFPLYLLIKNYKKSTGDKRAQIKYVIVGAILGYAGATPNLFLWYGINIPPYTFPLVSGWVFMLVYAIIMYRLIDIKFVLRKYSVNLVSLLTIILFLFPILIIANRFPPAARYALDLIIIIIAATVFPLAKKYYYRLANKYFFSSLYDGHSVVANTSYRLRSTLEASEVFNHLSEIFLSTIHIKSFAYLGYNNLTKEYHIQYNNGFFVKNFERLPISAYLFTHYINKSKAIIAEELKRENYVKYRAIIEYMSQAGIKILVPLNIKYRKVGLFVFGSKESGDIYNTEDLQTFEIIGGLASTALENARLYREIKEKSERLEGLLEMKSEFLRVVNHQLNTPVSIMRLGFSSADEKTIPFKKSMEIARAGLDRISTTLNDFWEAYELEGVKMKMSKEKINIEKIIKDLVAQKKIRGLDKKRKVTISFDKPDFEIPKVFCDANKITHALSNMLDNAIWYTLKGEVRISFKKIKKDNIEYLKISISDTGAGILPQDIKHLFRKFSRGSQAALLHPDGSGLGLYIAKGIIEANDGWLFLEATEVGQGSTFSILLPVYTSQEKEVRPVPKLKDIPLKKDYQPSPDIKRKKVLFIDDEKETLDLYSKFFTKYGLDFFSCNNIEEGLKIAKNIKPDIIYLDIIFPRVISDGTIDLIAEQGYDFLKIIKKDKRLRSIPVVMFTNLDTDEDRVKASKLGAVGYICKNKSEPMDLLAVLEEILKNKG